MVQLSGDSYSSMSGHISAIFPQPGASVRRSTGEGSWSNSFRG